MPQTPHLKITHPAALALLLACASAHLQVHAQICTREYAPVCGQKEQAAPQIFANRCVMQAAQAQSLPSSACTHLPQGQSLPPPAPAHRPRPGGDTDAHGCKPSAGYTWNSELASCARPWLSSAVTLQVAPERQACVGLIAAQCLLVRELTPGQDTPDWQPLHGGIAGFEPETGVGYTLRVRKDHLKNPPADTSDTRHTLLRVLP
jgi:hypothetical protein